MHRSTARISLFSLVICMITAALALFSCEEIPTMTDTEDTRPTLLGAVLCTEAEAEAYIAALQSAVSLPTLYADENGDAASRHPVPAAYADETPTYYLPLDMETADWDDLSLSVAGGTVYLVGVEEIPEKRTTLANGTQFRLLICGERYYTEAALICTGLPVFTIDLYNARKGTTISDTYIDRTAETMLLSFYDAHDPVTNGVVSEQSFGKIRTRGGTSAKYDKHSFKFSLYDDAALTDTNNLSFCGLRLDDDWVLNAMYQEETKIRDMLAYDLWEDIGGGHYGDGTVLGTRMRYVEVILGGQYWGLYGLCEPEDAKQFGISETNPGCVYKVGSWTVPSVEDIREAIVDDLDYVAEVEVKYPVVTEDNARDAWKPFLDHVELVYESSRHYFETQAGNYIAEDNLAEMYIFLNLITAYDNTWKNMYLVKREEDGLLAMAPWDCDISFGLVWRNGGEEDLHLYHDDSAKYDITGNDVFHQYLRKNVNDMCGRIYDRWCELRADWLNEEEILARANAFRAQITDSGALNRNRARWPHSGDAEDISYLTEYVIARIPFLDEWMADLVS